MTNIYAHINTTAVVKKKSNYHAYQWHDKHVIQLSFIIYFCTQQILNKYICTYKAHHQNKIFSLKDTDRCVDIQCTAESNRYHERNNLDGEVHEEGVEANGK